MRHPLLLSGLLAAVAFSSAARAEHSRPAPRPALTGISHIAVYTSDPAATNHYYADLIGAAKVADPEDPKGVRYMINATQFVEVLPLPPNAGINRLDHTGWKTENAEGLRLYLADKGWKVPATVTRNSDGSRSFRVHDPEDNLIEFVQPPVNGEGPDAPHVIGHHIIHVGFMVRSREAEDKFYRELLGFKPYWFGGMKDDKVDWVSQQTPQSHDWLEYMMTSGTPATGMPSDMTQQHLGVMDHLSIGVVSVPDSYKLLASESRVPGHADKEPKIGKDGKYQFNMYDPDGIRLELMEFNAREKPCCSPFTAENPRAE